MLALKRMVRQWGRWIASGLVVAVLFSQVALAMYACPALDSADHAASMQAAGLAMEDMVGMAAMPDCHAMPGTMDDEAPQLCRTHCASDGQLLPSLQGLDVASAAVHVGFVSYLLGALFDALPAASLMAAAEAPPDHRAGFPPIYLTLQVLRN